jgi:HEAT repeat protein
METVLVLSAVAAVAGLGPMAYVLLRQMRDRHGQKAAITQLEHARTLVAKGSLTDTAVVARALSSFDKHTIDATIEQLSAQPGTDEERQWIARLAGALGTLERYRERAQHARTWNERAHAVTVLGNLGAPQSVATLSAVLRDRNEDEAVRRVAADALGAVRHEEAIPLLIEELRSVDEQATSRVAEALIRFGSAATPPLIDLLGGKESVKARIWAARILTVTRDARAFDALSAGLRDRNDVLRAANAEALGQIADQRGLQPLMQVALRDPAPLVRAQAAVAAARIGGAEAIDVLVAALGDPDYATRLRALEAFESMRLSDTSPLEKALGDSNAEVRRRAALALERLGYLDQLVERLAGDDQKTRSAAYAALLQLGRAGVVEAIVGRLRHDSLRVRAAIAKACGELRAERVGPALIDALDDPAWPVRAALCEAISLVRPSRGGPALTALLADPDENVREAAATGLVAYAGPELELKGPDLRMIYDHGNVPVRLAMITIAASLNDADVSQLLIDATHDQSEAVRLRAVGALAARPNPAAIPALVAALTDVSIEVRVAAIPALGAAGTAESFEALLRTLPGAQPDVRERIAEALSGVGRQHFLQSIDELARTDQVDVRIGVAWTLGKIGDPIGVPALRSFMRDSDARLRASAAGALGKIQAPEAVNTLLSALDDPDPKTRAALVNALGKSGAGQPNVRLAIERRLYDPDAFVRNRAGIALARVAGAQVAELARSQELAQLLDDAALVVMQGLVGTRETIPLALQALGEPARLASIQRFLDREEPAICAAFLSNLRLSDGAGLGLTARLDPAVLAVQYERLIRSSPDGHERHTAVEAVAGMNAAEHSRVFADALSADPDDGVRLRCAQILSNIDDEISRDALILAVADPNPSVAVAAVHGLRNRRDPRVASALFRRLGAASKVINEAIEHVLAEMYQDDVIGFIDRTMGADRPALIIAAVRVIALMGRPNAMPLLRELLKSQDPGVRAAAVLATARTALPESPQLVAKMLEDPHEQVRAAAQDAIADEGQTAVAALLSTRSDPSPLVRSKLCQLLERFPSPGTRRIVEAMLEDGSAAVRASALLTLLGYGDRDSVRRAAAHWTEATPETIQHARSDARAPLISRKLGNALAGSGEGDGRVLIVNAIAVLAAEGHEELLLPVLRDPRSAVRVAAARALSTSTRPGVQECVRELSEDPELSVREAVRRRVSRPVS